MVVVGRGDEGRRGSEGATGMALSLRTRGRGFVVRDRVLEKRLDLSVGFGCASWKKEEVES